MSRMRAGLQRVALVCAAMLALAVPAGAQLTRGIISGTVSDTSGAVLPGVVEHLLLECRHDLRIEQAGFVVDEASALARQRPSTT